MPRPREAPPQPSGQADCDLLVAPVFLCVVPPPQEARRCSGRVRESILLVQNPYRRGASRGREPRARSRSPEPRKRDSLNIASPRVRQLARPPVWSDTCRGSIGLPRFDHPLETAEVITPPEASRIGSRPGSRRRRVDSEGPPRAWPRSPELGTPGRGSFPARAALGRTLPVLPTSSRSSSAPASGRTARRPLETPWPRPVPANGHALVARTAAAPGRRRHIRNPISCRAYPPYFSGQGVKPLGSCGFRTDHQRPSVQRR